MAVEIFRLERVAHHEVGSQHVHFTLQREEGHSFDIALPVEDAERLVEALVEQLRITKWKPDR